MGDKKNLTSENANEKIKALAEEIQTCLFCTYSGSELQSRPMSTLQVDDDGNIWFLSSKESNKNDELSENDEVHLFYGHGNDKFLTVHGTATISYNKEKIKELWTPIAKVWFTEGIDDPRISVIKVKVSDGYYWDNKHGKMVQGVKLAASLLTGKTMDDGIEGKLKK
jgi:general stress protein 26